MSHSPTEAIRRFPMLPGILGVAAVIAAADSTPCLAQFGVPAAQQINRPFVSPYLNLTQPGLNPGITYGSLIQPQLQMRNAIGNNQQQIQELQRTSGQPSPQIQPLTSSVQTGHETSFMNTFGYFPGLGAGAGNGSGAMSPYGGSRSSSSARH